MKKGKKYVETVVVQVKVKIDKRDGITKSDVLRLVESAVYRATYETYSGGASTSIPVDLISVRNIKQ